MMETGYYVVSVTTQINKTPLKADAPIPKCEPFKHIVVKRIDYADKKVTPVDILSISEEISKGTADNETLEQFLKDLPPILSDAEMVNSSDSKIVFKKGEISRTFIDEHKVDEDTIIDAINKIR